MVTAADETLDWSRHLPTVEIVRSPSRSTTTFENVYRDGSRTQRILAVADPVPVDAVPQAWMDSSIVHLAPVVHEVSGEFLKLFPRSLVGLTPQGLLREWGRSGLVSQGLWKGEDSLLSGPRVVVFSEEDVTGDPAFLPRCLAQIPVVVVTQGDLGATLYCHGNPTRFPAFPAKAVDPTGAGDVFAASFLVEYQRTGEPHRSTAFASCAASLAIERPGLEGIPDRKGVEERLALYQHPW